jgi:hypothetical protein
LGFESMHPCVQAWDLNPGLILSKLGIWIQASLCAGLGF